jgi:hypothetical protein
VTLLTRDFNTAENLLGGHLIKLVKITTTTSSNKNISRSPILNKKIPRMKFKEDVIITCEFFNREEIVCDGRNMKNIFLGEVDVMIAVIQHTTACYSMQVVDITLAE